MKPHAAIAERVRQTGWALAADREIRRRHGAVRDLMADLLAQQAVLEERAARESTDADRIEAWSLEWLGGWMAGTLAETAERERSEAVQAGLEALQHAHVLSVIEDEESRLTGARDTGATHAFWASQRALAALGYAHAVPAARTEMEAVTVREAWKSRIRLLEDALEAEAALPDATTPPDRGALRGRIVLALHAAGTPRPDTTVASLLSEARVSLENASANVGAAVEAFDAAVSSPPLVREAPTVRSALQAMRRAHELRVQRMLDVQERRASETALKGLIQAEKRERRDVLGLERFSLDRWMLWFQGRFDDVLDQQRDELETAVRARAAGEQQVELRAKRVLEVTEQLAALGDVETEFESVAKDLDSVAVFALAEKVREFAMLSRSAGVFEQLLRELKTLQRPPVGLFSGLRPALRQVQRFIDAVEKHNAEVVTYRIPIGPMDSSCLEDIAAGIQAMIVAGEARSKQERRRRQAAHRPIVLNERKRWPGIVKQRRERLSALRDEMTWRRQLLEMEVVDEIDAFEARL